MGKHLPISGAGPLIVGFMVILTLSGITLNHYGYLQAGIAENTRWIFLALGVSFMILGISLIISALIFSRMVHNIRSNQLMTEGVYSIVRNPLYSGFLTFSTGVLLLFCNLLLLAIPFLNWAFMTIVLKNTEERWLLNQYGSRYSEYCKRVSRCIPWGHKLRSRNYL